MGKIIDILDTTLEGLSLVVNILQDVETFNEYTIHNNFETKLAKVYGTAMVLGKKSR